MNIINLVGLNFFTENTVPTICFVQYLETALKITFFSSFLNLCVAIFDNEYFLNVIKK